MVNRKEENTNPIIQISFLRKMVLYVIVLLSISCSLFDPPGDDKNYFVADYDMENLPVTYTFIGPFDFGPVSNLQINEASGMVASRQFSNFLWVQNDSGDLNRIFLMGTDGKYQGTATIDGAQNRDWEDIAIGPGPTNGIDYVYVGDIGDNHSQYRVKNIYRFPEPDIRTFAEPSRSIEVKDAQRISFVFQGDVKMDAETLLVDPWTGDIFVVTKRELPATVYHLPFPQSTTGRITAKKYGTLPFTMAVGGDISPDGKMIIIKNYDHIFLWTRNEGETLADAFLRQPVKLVYVKEPQGEAIAFAPDKRGYYTLSEAVAGETPRLFFYRNTAP